MQTRLESPRFVEVFVRDRLLIRYSTQRLKAVASMPDSGLVETARDLMRNQGFMRAEIERAQFLVSHPEHRASLPG